MQILRDRIAGALIDHVILRPRDAARRDHHREYHDVRKDQCLRSQSHSSRPYPMRSTKRKARAPSSTPAPSCACYKVQLRNLDLLDLSRLFLYDGSRERRVLEV